MKIKITCLEAHTNEGGQLVIDSIEQETDNYPLFLEAIKAFTSKIDNHYNQTSNTEVYEEARNLTPIS